VIAAARQLAVCTLLVALAVSTPVIGWCATARHQGQTLHPIFDHVHHADHADHVVAPSDDTALAEAVRESRLVTEHGTSWSATGIPGSPAWLAGVQALTPLHLPTILPSGGARVRFETVRPFEHLQAPTPPPPRRAG
jgi:hypothetical protein